MELLTSAVLLGFAGLDILGIPIILAALAAKTGKRAILHFALTVLLATILGGLILAQILGSSVNLIAEIYQRLPDSVWIALDVLLIATLSWWLYCRLKNNNRSPKSAGDTGQWMAK